MQAAGRVGPQATQWNGPSSTRIGAGRMSAAHGVSETCGIFRTTRANTHLEEEGGGVAPGPVRSVVIASCRPRCMSMPGWTGRYIITYMPLDRGIRGNCTLGSGVTAFAFQSLKETTSSGPLLHRRRVVVLWWRFRWDFWTRSCSRGQSRLIYCG